MAQLLAMPILVVNLGVEMLYILDQRLKAQEIPGDKSSRVLLDVVKTMFDPVYVEKLFTPQELYSVSSTRKIFDRLAHSSIMRLSESSMDKLFDLMTMGLKYQLLCATSLDQMLKVSQLHISSIKAILADIPEVQPLLNRVDALLVKTYSQLSMGALHLLRQTLMRFFQDKRIKVSLFLQEGIQSTMGRLILPSPITDGPGKVTYFSSEGAQEQQEHLRLAYRDTDPREFFIHPCVLGSNLYNKDRPKVVPPVRKGDLLTGPVKRDEEPTTPQRHADTYADKGSKGARQELDLLSALLTAKQAPNNFKLNLFGDEFELGGGSSTGPSSTATASHVQTLNFGAEGKNEAYRSGAGALADVIKGLNVTSAEDDEEEDLLALMDAT